MGFFLLKKSRIAGGVILLVFTILLLHRVGVLQPAARAPQTAKPQGARDISDSDTWMTIRQKGHKIGYTHRRFSKSPQGYTLDESVFLRLHVMGMSQEVRFRTRGELGSDWRLSTFDFELESSLLRFAARGEVVGSTLHLLTGEPGEQRRTEIRLAAPPYLGSGVLHATWASGMEVGESRSFHVFDPATTGQRPANVAVLGEDTLRVMGRETRAKRVSVDFMGSTQIAWIDAAGQVVREEGPLEIDLEWVSREEALSALSESRSGDLTEAASIASDQTIEDAASLSTLKVHVKASADLLRGLDGGRQSFRDSVLKIVKETLPPPGRGTPENPKTSPEAGYLGAGPFIQADHPEIRKVATGIVSSGDTPLIKAQKIVRWVHEHIEKRPVLSVPDALATLRRAVGDCNEHAVLVAALARAAGVPAQIETGLVYLKGRFYYHAWNVLYVGAWMTADSVFDQFPADVTHIRFVRGDPESQIDVIGMLGKVELSIMETG